MLINYHFFHYLSKSRIYYSKKHIMLLTLISDEIKFSLAPNPIINGLPFLQATILSGSSSHKTAIAYAPTISDVAFSIAWVRSPV